MKKITRRDGSFLKEGDYILWKTDIQEMIGFIHRYGHNRGEDFFIKFENNSVPQYLSINELQVYAYKINSENDPEYFI